MKYIWIDCKVCISDMNDKGTKWEVEVLSPKLVSGNPCSKGQGTGITVIFDESFGKRKCQTVKLSSRHQSRNRSPIFFTSEATGWSLWRDSSCSECESSAGSLAHLGHDSIWFIVIPYNANCAVWPTCLKFHTSALAQTQRCSRTRVLLILLVLYMSHHILKQLVPVQAANPILWRSSAAVQCQENVSSYTY